MNKEKEIEAIEIVKRLTMRKMSLYDHFYCGDKDTYIEACQEIFENNNLPNYYDLEKEDLNKHLDTYYDEIDEKYNELVSLGKEMFSFLIKVNEHLDDLLKDSEMND